MSLGMAHHSHGRAARRRFKQRAEEPLFTGVGLSSTVRDAVLRQDQDAGGPLPGKRQVAPSDVLGHDAVVGARRKKAVGAPRADWDHSCFDDSPIARVDPAERRLIFLHIDKKYVAQVHGVRPLRPPCIDGLLTYPQFFRTQQANNDMIPLGDWRARLEDIDSMQDHPVIGSVNCVDNQPRTPSHTRHTDAERTVLSGAKCESLMLRVPVNGHTNHGLLRPLRASDPWIRYRARHEI